MNRVFRAGGAIAMPVARYFLFVGGVLLALLFVIDAFAPQEAAVASASAPSIDKTRSIDKTTVRIKSAQKLPERVVYDTSLPTIVPPTATVVAAAATARAPEISAQAHVRDTFAQFIPAEARKIEKIDQPQAPKKRKIAKAHPSQQPVRLAQQQPHFGFFGGPTWNSTW
jgi:hypothetical protein